MIVTLGNAALSNTQHQSELERAELSMTLFDSRAAMVALGSSETQRLQFGQDNGQYSTRPDTGQLSIIHYNYTEGESQELYNESLGSVVYTNDETNIAYQGGGVWRLGPNGASQMLSPPEFHFRGATLTLPVIRVSGESHAAGAVAASVSKTESTEFVFPSDTSYETVDRQFQNPIRNGTVEVHITSEYYEGWASYFEQRTAGDVDVHHGNQTVHLQLISLAGSIGQFPMPDEKDGLDVIGMGTGHPVENFEITLSEGQTSGGENHWALYSGSGNTKFELHIDEFDLKKENECQARISVFYENAYTGEHQEWQTGILTESDDAISCTDDNMTVFFTSDSSIIEYREIEGATGSGTKFCYGEDISENADFSANLSQHKVDPSAAVNKTGNSEQTLNFTVNHYLSRLGADYNLVVKDAQGNSCGPESEDNGKGSKKGSDSVNEDASSGVLEFAEVPGAKYITFLHVTENEVTVDFN